MLIGIMPDCSLAVLLMALASLGFLA